VLLEHGKEWCRLYRVTFGGAVATRNLERIGRSEPSLETTPADLRYRNWAAIVAGLTPREREYLNLVCIEYGDSWTLPPFLERLVNCWKARQRPPLYAGASSGRGAGEARGMVRCNDIERPIRRVT
jgi:hypothetical protein